MTEPTSDDRWRQKFYDERKDWDAERMLLDLLWYSNEQRKALNSIKSNVFYMFIFLVVLPLIVGLMWALQNW